MNCPSCGADITEEIDSFVESTGYCFGFIFVCPKCREVLGVRTGEHGKTEVKDAGSN